MVHLLISAAFSASEGNFEYIWEEIIFPKREVKCGEKIIVRIFPGFGCSVLFLFHFIWQSLQLVKPVKLAL